MAQTATGTRTKAKAASPKKNMSPQKAARRRRRAQLRGPLDGWAFPLALATSLLLSGAQIAAVLTGTGALDAALRTWGSSLIFSWVCWAVIAAAMRTTKPTLKLETPGSSSGEPQDGATR